MIGETIQLKLCFCDCDGVRTSRDVTPIALTLAQQEFLAAEGKVPNLRAVDDVSELVVSHTIAFQYGLMGTWSVAFPVLLTWSSNPTISFDCGDTSAGVTKCEIGGLFTKNENLDAERFAQQLVKLGLASYLTTRPAVGFVDASFANETSFEQVKRAKLVSISWANFFGTSYVEKYGKDFLMGLPGYRKEMLPDGGVFHQLTETFLAADHKGAKAIRQDVVEYCKQAGLRVSCRAPY